MEREELLVNKVREVKIPQRACKNDAGIDFFIPEMDEKFIRDFYAKNPGYTFDLKEMEVPCIPILPQHRVLIPSGIRVIIKDKATALIAANKSGISTKFGLIFTAQVVDADYTGEIHIGVLNTNTSNDHVVCLYPGDKVIQFIHTPIVKSDIREIGELEYAVEVDKMESDRGEGGFGSTDKK